MGVYPRSFVEGVNPRHVSPDCRVHPTTNPLGLAEFSYVHTYHSFQSEFCSGCLRRLYAASRRACAPVLALCSLFRIVGTASSAGSIWSRLGSRSALRRVNPETAGQPLTPSAVPYAPQWFNSRVNSIVGLTRLLTAFKGAMCA